MLKVIRISICRNNESSLFNQCYQNPFWNWSKECIIDRYMLTPRTRSKSFNLSVCNRIMCFAFHSQNISVSKKKRGLQFNLCDKRVASKILIRAFLSSE